MVMMMVWIVVVVCIGVLDLIVRRWRVVRVAKWGGSEVCDTPTIGGILSLRPFRRSTEWVPVG